MIDLVRCLLPRELAGKVVVLTGATAGIGRCTALRLARGGATVVAVARHLDALDELAAEDDRIVVHQADVADDTERVALVDRVVRDLGRVDVLVNNLGVGWSGPFEDMDLAQVRRMAEINLVAPIHLSELVLDAMLARRDGDIVLMASAASWFATPPLTVYSATKYGLEGFAEGLRREVLGRGVRVHSIHPGPVSTEFAGRAAGDVPGVVDGTPAPGPGVDPERVARAVEGALTRPGVHVHAVPRVLGLTRLVKLPGVQQVADLAVASVGSSLARGGRRLAERAAGHSAQ